MKTVVVHFTDEGEKPLRFEGCLAFTQGQVLMVSRQIDHISGDYLASDKLCAIYAPGVWRSAILEETP